MMCISCGRVEDVACAWSNAVVSHKLLGQNSSEKASSGIFGYSYMKGLLLHVWSAQWGSVTGHISKAGPASCASDQCKHSCLYDGAKMKADCLQVYLLLSCCPCEGRLSGIVDVPNACATLAIPIAIFDQVPALLHQLLELLEYQHHMLIKAAAFDYMAGHQSLQCLCALHLWEQS